MHSQQQNPAAAPSYAQKTGEVARHMDMGDYEGAIAILLGMPDEVSRDPIGCNILGYLLLHVGRPKQAIGWFEAMLALQPGHPGATAGLGMACLGAGLISRALTVYDQALVLRPDDPESWYHRAVVLVALGRLDEAQSSLERTIALKPDYRLAFAKRAEIHETRGELGPAVIAAQRAAQLGPDILASWRILADLLQKQGLMNRSLAAYDRALAVQPDDFHSLCHKGQVLRQLERFDEARAVALQALALDPQNREALLLAGGVAVDRDALEEAQIHFEAAARQGIACSYQAARKPARFRALLLFSPLSGNTPYEDLLKNNSFDADVLLVLPGFRYDPAALEIETDVVINLVAEPDKGMDMLVPAIEITDWLKRPVLNAPQLIGATDRESIARRLADLEGAVMPETTRITAEALCAALDAGNGPALPVIIREAGTHGGERMELAEDEAALRAFAGQAGDQPLYLTRYVDYSSPDGHFRKYRFLFVGEEILPYHLAIGDGWKVHHLTTRMAETRWMREEEAAFLDDPHAVFGPRGMAVLEAIRQRIGLDYFGIDCSLDEEGRVVIFEVNATMLIHFRNEGFDYKTPHVERIRTAFEALAARLAGA